MKRSIIKKTIGLKQIKEGAVVPFGWGIAWYDYDARCEICYPIPFNILIRFLKQIYYLVASNHKQQDDDKIYQVGYNNGYNSGCNSGYDKGFTEGKAFVFNSLYALAGIKNVSGEEKIN